MKATCEQCLAPFEAVRRSSLFCGPTCRQRASRAARSGQKPPETDIAPVLPLETGEKPLIATTRRELEAAGRLDTIVGQLALELAEKVCSDRDTGSAKAAASKEFRAVMADALADVTKKADSLDELMERRLKKASGA